MATFKQKKIELKPGDLSGADVDFYEYDFYPVIYINNSKLGELGGIALFGEIRTFPLDAIYSYNASKLSEKEFLDKFPDLRIYFESPEKQAA